MLKKKIEKHKCGDEQKNFFKNRQFFLKKEQIEKTVRFWNVLESGVRTSEWPQKERKKEEHFLLDTV